MTRAQRSDSGIPRKDESTRLVRRTVRLDAEMWDYCQSHGDASEYIRRLVSEDKGRMVYIYTLADPRDNSIFYVGQTGNLSRRLKEHVSDGVSRGRGEKSKIIRSIVTDGKLPIISAVKLVLSSDAIACEREEIERLTSLGHRLINVNTEPGTNPRSLVSRKDTCVACLREDMKIAAMGMCFTCYRKQLKTGA